MFGRLRELFCRRGLHWWSFVGWADYGRGRLEKCSRKRADGTDCDAVRCVKVSEEKLAKVRADEAKKITGRQKKPKTDDKLEAEIRAVGEPAQERPHSRRNEDACPACHGPITASTASRCPQCGSRRIRK